MAPSRDTRRPTAIKGAANRDLPPMRLTADVAVNKPLHYNDSVYETIDVIESKRGREGMISWVLGEIDKYTSRVGKKGDPADARRDVGKIRFYSILLEAIYDGRTISSTGVPTRRNVNFEPAHPTVIQTDEAWVQRLQAEAQEV